MNEMDSQKQTLLNQLMNNFRHGVFLLIVVVGFLFGPINQAYSKPHPIKKEDCSPLGKSVVQWFVSNQDTPNPIESLLGPIRNQEKEDACFAVAAADLISHKTEIPISTSNLLAQYFKNPENVTLFEQTKGGSVSKLLKEVLGHFVCEENSWPFNPKREGIMLNSNIQDYKYLKCSHEPNVYLQTLLVKPFNLKKQAGIQTLDEVLKRNQIAIIQYNRIFMSKSSQSENLNHASTVIGRYFDSVTKTCRYIVRNTWGPQCNKNVNSKIPCKKGYYAFSKEQLRKNAYLGIYLDNRLNLSAQN
jgi:hypothetical protein